MLDIKYIRSDPELVRNALGRRGPRAGETLEELLGLDRSRREVLVQLEERRGLRNTVSDEIAKLKKAGEDATTQVGHMRKVGEEIKDFETHLKEIEASLEEKLLQVPNLADPTAPAGGEEDSAVLHHWGEPRKFTFTPLDHLDLAAPRDLIDMERGARTSGSRFAYLKGDLVHLQFALVQFALQKLSSKGFRPCIVPVLVRDEAMYGTGFFPTDMQ
jgi:seryl-tRNA synthetase